MIPRTAGLLGRTPGAGIARAPLTGKRLPKPDEISGLVLWLHPEDVTDADGAAVTGWTDRKSSILYSPSGTGTIKRAASSVLGGKPAIEFDGNGHLTGTEYIRSAVWSMIAVIYNSSSEAENAAFQIGGYPCALVTRTNSVAGSGAGLVANGMAWIASGFGYVIGKYIHAATRSGPTGAGTYKMYRDGVKTRTHTEGISTSPLTTCIGYDGETTTRRLIGSVGQICVYNRELTESEVADLCATFKEEYGIT